MTSDGDVVELVRPDGSVEPLGTSGGSFSGERALTMATRKLGMWMVTALVVGNMIGSGIFLLPASLGSFGGISIVGWLVSAAGATLWHSSFLDSRASFGNRAAPTSIRAKHSGFRGVSCRVGLLDIHLDDECCDCGGLRELHDAFLGRARWEPHSRARTRSRDDLGAHLGQRSRSTYRGRRYSSSRRC